VTRMNRKDVGADESPFPSSAMVGLNGDFRGTCIGCMRGTDTGLAFKGEAEWAIAGVVICGVPLDQAVVIVSDGLGVGGGEVPGGEVVFGVRCCHACAPMDVGLIATGVPVYSPTKTY
jgi:hypothetical protein